MAKKVNFTKTVIEGLPWSRSKETVYSDSKVPHFRIKISPMGRKTYQVYMKYQGKPTKRLVGTYPELSPEVARQVARQIIAELTMGIDRHEEIVKKRNEPTYREIWAEYYKYLVDKAKQKPKTWEKNVAQYDSLFNAYKELHDLPLSQITTERLIKFHRRYSIDIGSKINANNIIRQIRASLNYANIEPNPAVSRKLKLNKQFRRKKYLKVLDLQSFVNATLQDKSRDYRDVFLLMIFTAARVGSVMSMEWSEVNLKYGVWETVTKSSGNDRDVTSIGLIQQAKDILERRKRLNVPASKWVFPANSKSGHVTQPQKAFARILKTAGLSGYTPHDLRRSAASHLSQNAGVSPQQILALLGNKSLETVGIYARGDIEIVKDQYGNVVDKLLEGIAII
ncbi:MAG: tyrosine-type recombinase/integrase [Thiohalomonadales bacterium]